MPDNDSLLCTYQALRYYYLHQASLKTQGSSVIRSPRLSLSPSDAKHGTAKHMEAKGEKEVYSAAGLSCKSWQGLPIGGLPQIRTRQMLFLLNNTSSFIQSLSRARNLAILAVERDMQRRASKKQRRNISHNGSCIIYRIATIGSSCHSSQAE